MPPVDLVIHAPGTLHRYPLISSHLLCMPLLCPDMPYPFTPLSFSIILFSILSSLLSSTFIFPSYSPPDTDLSRVPLCLFSSSLHSSAIPFLFKLSSSFQHYSLPLPSITFYMITLTTIPDDTYFVELCALLLLVCINLL